MILEVAVLDGNQVYVLTLLAVKVAELPEQIAVGDATTKTFAPGV
jgi:hypothetical protein